MREKWENRADYRDWTITRAIESTLEHWRGVSAVSSNGQPQDEPQSAGSNERNASSNGDEQVIDTIDDLLAVFRKWLYFQDTSSIEVLLGAYVANLMPGDAFWLMLVGPPSSGKTEPILATRGLPHVPVIPEYSYHMRGTLVRVSGSPPPGPIIRLRRSWPSPSPLSTS